MTISTPVYCVCCCLAVHRAGGVQWLSSCATRTCSFHCFVGSRPGLQSGQCQVVHNLRHQLGWPAQPCIWLEPGYTDSKPQQLPNLAA